MTLFLSLSLTTSTYAANQCRLDCEDVIKASKKAIAARDQQISDQNKTILDLTSLQTITKSDLDRANTSLNAWYHNPVILGLLGAAVGGASIIVLQRR
jgi:hypothetical protein